MDYQIKRVKKAIGHMGGMRLSDECRMNPVLEDGEQFALVVGWIPRQSTIGSPYVSSPVHVVYAHPRYGTVVISEIHHREYAMFTVSGKIFTDENEATLQEKREAADLFAVGVR